MDYTEFINEELANNLENIFNKMKDMNLIDNSEYNSTKKILDKTRKDLRAENSRK